MNELWAGEFMPHGHCYFWNPEIVWSHAIGDSIIATAYFFIPLTLVHIVRKRRDFNYIWLGLLFAVFILGCGTTHVFDVLNIWKPWYVADAVVRIITALASIGTAIMLIKITPQILVIPSVEKWKQVNEDLFVSNTKLLKSNEELTKTEKILKELNADLEVRVQQRTEEAIKKAEEFSFLADAIPQLVWTAGPSGSVNYVNKRWLGYTGQSEEETLRGGWSRALHPDHLEMTLALWKESVETGKEFRTEYCLRRHDGEYRWFLANGVPMRDGQGNIVKWFGTSTEIHDQKAQTRELEAKNTDLRRINNDLDNFIYTASHDLKAPISNMEGLLNTIYDETRESCKGDVIELFGMLETSIRRLKTTIEDLTDISRIQKNIQEQAEPVPVMEILDEYKENHKEQLEKCHAVLTSDLQVEQIKFSVKNFRSILYNLINNAIKYHHPDRAPEIHVSTRKEDEYVVLEVTDNGLGLDMSQKDKIFGMFKRLHDHVEGSGVGLYIVKRIMENANGRVDVESEVGKGAAFKVYFKI